MNKRQIVISLRLFFGLLVFTALGMQIASLVRLNVFNAISFLSYFTNLSNIFAATVFLVSTIYLSKRRKPSTTDDIIRGAAVLYMAVTGLVYVTLLSGEDLGLLIPWVNVVLHYIMPLAVVLDWLYQPQQTKLAARQTLLWLIFPLLYLTYSLVRGPYVNWYPYPFLNPEKVGGYGGVALYCLGILAVFFAFGWIIQKLGNKLKQNIE